MKCPSMNEFIAANRSGKYQGAKMKKLYQTQVEWDIRTQIRGLKAKEPVHLRFNFYEENTKRDLDNISSFAHKIIQDGLVKQGVLQNDGWKNIKGYTDNFFITDENPRIDVVIIEAGDSDV